MSKLIIFDCDGVIIDSEILACSIEVRHLAELGYNISLDEYMDSYMGRCFQDIIDDIQKKSPALDIDAFCEMSAGKIYTDEFKNNLKALPEIENLLQNLKYPFCIASGSSIERLNYTLDLVGLLPYFENKIFSAEMVENSKPSPDIFLYAAQQMGYNPKDCIVIEDSINGVKAGIAAGMETYAFVGGKHMNDMRAKALIEAGAALSFSSMKDLNEHLSKI